MALRQYGSQTDAGYLFRKIKGRLKRKVTRIRKTNYTELPKDWSNVPVETVLNSRCTSDFDDDPARNHWGMADGGSRLSPQQLEMVDQTAQYQRFTTGVIGIDRKENRLLFYIDSEVPGVERDLLMIESGVAMQAYNLTCTAMGISAIVSNMGDNGTLLPDGKLAMLCYELVPMKPSYNGGYWSDTPPAGESAWQTGNLPDPDRKGNVPLIEAVSKASLKIPGKKTADYAGFSQLLWAARGRTPHFYMSKAWGVTIPLAHGNNSRSDVLVLTSEESLHRYINWSNDKPTHSIERINGDYTLLAKQLKKRFPLRETFVLFRSFGNEGNALWEIGFMLQNLLVEASALDISIDSAIDLKGISTNLENGKLRAVVALTLK